MREIVHKKYLANKKIFKLVRELEQLALAARVRHEIFFDKYLNGFKKNKGGC